MADTTGPPSGNPLVPKFTQAFGFAVDAEALTAQINSTIDTAKQVAESLTGKVQQSMVSTLVDAHVGTNTLQQKLAESMAAKIVDAQQTLAVMQQPIASAVVNTLGGIAESVLPFGVKLPAPGMEAPCPDCVVIRSSAAAGDLGPALQCYRDRVLPLRDSRGTEYAQQLEWLTNCLPPVDGIHAQFSLAIQRLQNEPFLDQSFVAVPAPQAPGAASAASVVSLAAGGAPPPISGDCETQLSLWALRGMQAMSACITQFPDDPVAQGNCQTQVAQQLQQALPACAPPGFGFTPGGPTFNGRPWSPSGGSPGGSGGSPQPKPQPVPAPVPPGQPGAPPGAPGAPPGAPSGGGSGSAGGPSTSPPGSPSPAPGCDPAFIQQFFTQQAQAGATLDAAAAAFTAATGIACYPTASQSCDTGYTFFAVPANSGTNQYAGVCIKCPAPPCGNQTVQVPSCGTVQVVVNCPAPGQSSPPTTPPLPPSKKPPIPEGQGPTGISPVQVTGCNEFGVSQGVQIPGNFAAASRWLGIRKADGSLNVPMIENDPTGLLTGIASVILGTAAIVVDSAGSWAQAIIGPAACMSGNNLSLTMSETILRFISQYTGAPLEQLTTPSQQQRNYNCPVDLPGVSAAAAAYLSNTIDTATLECWVRAAGSRFPEAFTTIDANRTKLSAGQYATLLRRAVIDPQTYARKMRESGFLRDDDVANVYELTKQLPPPSDIVSMMTRDAADTKNIDWTKEDALFPDKFTGQLADWAKQQGVDETYMQMLWRAHFGIPAPGQLATMLHRLSRLPAGDPAYVDIATVRQALIQQDISPKWVEQFIAISYNPLTRIDARRAFEVGALSEQALKDSYLNLGYNTDDAETLVQFNKKNITRTFLRRPEVAQLAKGQMSDQEFQDAMRDWGASDDAIQAGRDRAKILRSVAARTECLKAYKKRFLQGDFDSASAISRLTGQQIELDTANVIVSGWQCELDARGKLFSASQLAGLYSDGLIDETDFVRRAIRLGWDNDDAVIMLRQVQRRQGIKAATAQQKEIAAEQRAADKLARQLRQAARQANTAARQQAASITKAQGVQSLRTHRLMQAAEKFSKHSGTDLGTAIVQVRAVYNQARENFPVTADEVIAALTTICSDKSVTNLPTLTADLATALSVAASPVV